MIVEKRVYRPKQQDQQTMADMIKEGHAMIDFPLTFRILTPDIAPWGVVVHEIEFKDLAQRQEFWEKWFASDKAPAFIERWLKITDGGVKAETWNLVD